MNDLIAIVIVIGAVWLVLLAVDPSRALAVGGIALAAVVALAAGVVALVARFGRAGRAEPEPELGPAPADGFAPGAGDWYEAKRERQERAKFRTAYEAGRSDARSERVDHLLGVAAGLAGRGRKRGGRKRRS